jgi:hypothetical protein
MILEKYTKKNKKDENIIDDKAKSITITNHGITYTITSNFHGICITNDHAIGMSIFSTDDKHSIILK